MRRRRNTPQARCHADDARTPLPPLPQVFTTAEALAPFHGVARARAALERVRVGAHSAMETPARLALVDAGLGEPLPQARRRGR